MRAYAIVTARNVVVSHGRTQLVHDRHLHRLVERTTTEGPEELVVEREDAQAMVVALSRLDGTERELLVRHEVGGETTQALAAELGTSAGALAMRLARARATLRLEYVLVSRNIELPSRRCRAVLLSLSTRDLRRQRDLDVANPPAALRDLWAARRCRRPTPVELTPPGASEPGRGRQGRDGRLGARADVINEVGPGRSAAQPRSVPVRPRR
jgi:hypothetical protein